VTQDASFWTLDDEGFAQLNVGAMRAQVDPSRPHFGLQQLSWHDSPLAIQSLGARWERFEDSPTPGLNPNWPMLPAETYVRANDLVATYRTEPDWPYRPQIYWRANVLGDASGALASLSLIVSIQTDLLDTRPQINGVSHLWVSDLFHVAVGESDHSTQALTGPRTHILKPSASAHCLVVRLLDGETSYVECVPASDFQELWVSPANDETRVAKLEWVLFNGFLEKGVIRRAWVHMFLLPRENDIELAAECCRVLAKRPLPLTT
jgi:hypothetical protein